MIDEKMMKFAKIRNSYAMKKFGTLSNEERALHDYDGFCLELIVENQELKKKNEEYQLQNIDLRADIMIQKKALPNKKIKDKTFYNLLDMPTYEDLLNQQKEFIEYLEEKEKEFDILGDPKNAGACKGIRKKYQEIIGRKDE